MKKKGKEGGRGECFLRKDRCHTKGLAYPSRKTIGIRNGKKEQRLQKKVECALAGKTSKKRRLSLTFSTGGEKELFGVTGRGC